MMTDPFWRGIVPVVFNVFSLNRIFSLVSIAGGEFPQIFLNEWKKAMPVSARIGQRRAWWGRGEA